MELNKYIDHTNLKPTATCEDIFKLCMEAKEYGFASVCVNSYWVRYCSELLKDSDVAVCTVVGFPLGAMSTKAKTVEAIEAVKDGADEIDMVINLGDVKDKHFDKIKGEIALLKSACGDKILKVIIETCLLTEEEKIKMCEIVTEAGADFIKTSTGFSTSGATFDDIALFKKYVGENVKIKAAGGISSFDDAKKFIELGADRLGTSRLVKIAKAEA